ncbi:MAG: hypothetical protein MJZ71_04055 [Bacteroidales bacterium]|nr:hypothetical protein [Bacteroidales bacterium]
MINYVKVKRTITVGDNPGTKYLARLWRNNDISLDTLAKEVSYATTVSYPDVLAVLKAFEIGISNHVMNGSAVKLGMLGAFIPQLNAKAQNTLDDVTADTVKRVSCRFYPGVEFKNILKATPIEERDLNVKGIQLPVHPTPTH